MWSQREKNPSKWAEWAAFFPVHSHSSFLAANRCGANTQPMKMHWHKRLFASVISLAYIASRKWMQRARERPLWLCTLPISINKLIKIALPNWRIQSDVKLKKRHEFYDDRGKNRMRIRLLHKNRASTLHTNISVILVYGDFFLSANGFFSVASMQAHFFIAYAVFLNIDLHSMRLKLLFILF